MDKKLFIYILIIIIASNIYIYSKNNNFEIEVYYFHATARCEGCLKIESYTYSSLNKYFKKEINNGLIKIKSIDFLLPENEHYSQKYNFDTQTLIISKKVNGEEIAWKNLDKIWDYSSNYSKYSKYIINEINNFLKN